MTYTNENISNGNETTEKRKSVELSLEYGGEGYAVLVNQEKIFEAIMQELRHDHPHEKEERLATFLDNLRLSFVSKESPSELSATLTKFSDILKKERRKQGNLPSTPIDNIAFVNTVKDGVEAYIDLQHITDLMPKNKNPVVLNVDQNMPAEYREKLLKERLTSTIKVLVATIAACYTPSSKFTTKLQDQYGPAEKERADSKSVYLSSIVLRDLFKKLLVWHAIVYPGFSDMGQGYLRILMACGLTGWVLSDLRKELSQASANHLARETFDSLVKDIISNKMTGEDQFVEVNK